MKIGVSVEYPARVPVYWTKEDFISHRTSLDARQSLDAFIDDLYDLEPEEKDYYGESIKYECLDDDGDAIFDRSSDWSKATQGKIHYFVLS